MERYVLAFDTDSQEFTREVISKEQGLKQFYKLMHCDMVEVHQIKVGDETYDIWLDEEAMFKDRQRLSVYYIGEDGFVKPWAFNSYAITKGVSKDGDTLGLTQKQLEKFLKDAVIRRVYTTGLYTLEVAFR